jgi:hypothetical protein
MSQLTKLHELNGKLDMLQDLKISGLGLSLEQQEKLLYTHQQVLDQRFELLKEIKKEYIL